MITAQKRNSIAGQYPAAVILSCIDSRAPAEIVLDAGIGETFNSRVAGNISNRDMLGSMEFACAVAGAKVVLVIGHTRCGAVRCAIDNAELGNLTGLLDEIKPAIAKRSIAVSVKVAIMILSMRWHEKCRADYRKHPQKQPGAETTGR